MGQVARLTIHETVRPEGGAIEALSAEMGRLGATRLLGVVFDELGEALGDLDAAYRAGDRARIAARVAPLVAPCERVGLTRIAAVARDLVALGEDDGAVVGFFSVAARLIRLTEGCLTEACAAPDMTL